MDQVIRDRFDSALAKADLLRSSVRPTGDRADRADNGRFMEWRTQSLTLLRAIFPDDHAYVVGFAEAMEYPYYDSVKIERGRGVLVAAHQDYLNGYLWTLRELVHADVFDDFLEMAVHLSETGYRTQAVVTAGSTLEEHLRQLCGKHSVTVHRKAAMTNDELHKAQVYSRPEWRQVQTWLDLRNDSGGHTTTTATEPERIREMIDGIRSFMVRHPA